jgi:protein tyrosine phosphatase (PTP) superfamily phosphohydrolase (DUF442 family)
MKRRVVKYWVLIPLALLLVVVLLALWFLHDDNFRQVGDNQVYRMAQPSAAALEAITLEYGIVSLLNLRGANPDAQWYRQELAAAGRLGLDMRDIPLSSRELPNLKALNELVKSLTELPRPLLLHCQHGRDRSGLAAVILGLLGEGGSMEQAWGEVSIWRGVVHGDSVGRQFLAQYQGWLEGQGLGQDPAIFRRFLAEGYRDADHNLLILLDRINGERHGGSADSPVTIGQGEPRLRLAGWIFDPVLGSIPQTIEILWGERPLGQAEIGGLRRDVAKVYADPRMERSGWQFTAPLEGLKGGCGDLHLRVTRSDGETIRSAAKARLCFDPESG